MSPLVYDYELRGLAAAYKQGNLDEDGLALLDETLAEYGLTRKDLR